MCEGEDAVGGTKETGDFGGGHGSGEVVALAVAAAHLAEDGVLLQGFDAFGDDAHVEGASKLDDGADDVEGLVAVLKAGDKGTIDL